MPVTTTVASTPDAPRARPASRRSWAWLGLVPFLLFALMFLLLPVWFLVVGSFQDKTGSLTLQNYQDLARPDIVLAFRTTIEVSLVTAVAGTILGFLMAYAVILGGLPGFLRAPLVTFAGVASNFAGVPLALAFIFTLGQLGMVTVFLRETFGINIYQQGFSLYTQVGLELVYLYFQLPLMILIIAPAIDGLKKDWREAAENLGATSRQYWRHVALPILMPSLMGTAILLFGNAFGAQATAYQLTGGTIPILAVKIGAQISGDVLHNVGLGYAMAMGMVIVMAVAIGLYLLLQRKAERWMR
ncbi:MAG: ABC transporter permease subunit [Chloroflexi bacterium]|nr:ABC transporter permease subunit [Chloroflexota bacterium]